MKDSTRLQRIKEWYAQVEEHWRETREGEGIVKALKLSSGTQEDITICKLVTALDTALDNNDALNHAQWKDLYTTLCTELNIHHSFVFPFLSYDPVKG